MEISFNQVCEICRRYELTEEDYLGDSIVIQDVLEPSTGNRIGQLLRCYESDSNEYRYYPVFRTSLRNLPA